MDSLAVDHLIRKLDSCSELTRSERIAMRKAEPEIRRFGAHEELVREGAPAGGVSFVIEGITCRYKLLRDGRRQIVAYSLPGDMCDLRIFILERADHSIGSVSSGAVAILPRTVLQNLTRKYPGVLHSLWCVSLAEEAITREWLVNVGHRTALERAAHLICEYFYRMQAVGLVRDASCEFPFTQAELADSLALSPVHVNRVLMQLRRAELIRFESHTLHVLDARELQSIAGFSPHYLQVAHRLRGSAEIARALAENPRQPARRR